MKLTLNQINWILNRLLEIASSQTRPARYQIVRIYTLGGQQLTSMLDVDKSGATLTVSHQAKIIASWRRNTEGKWHRVINC